MLKADTLKLINNFIFYRADSLPLCFLKVFNCPIPDDHIAPRRSALFMARSVLEAARDGESDAHQTA